MKNPPTQFSPTLTSTSKSYNRNAISKSQENRYKDSTAQSKDQTHPTDFPLIIASNRYPPKLGHSDLIHNRQKSFLAKKKLPSLSFLSDKSENQISTEEGCTPASNFKRSYRSCNKMGQSADFGHDRSREFNKVIPREIYWLSDGSNITPPPSSLLMDQRKMYGAAPIYTQNSSRRSSFGTNIPNNSNGRRHSVSNTPSYKAFRSHSLGRTRENSKKMLYDSDIRTSEFNINVGNSPKSVSKTKSQKGINRTEGEPPSERKNSSRNCNIRNFSFANGTRRNPDFPKNLTPNYKILISNEMKRFQVTSPDTVLNTTSDASHYSEFLPQEPVFRGQYFIDIMNRSRSRRRPKKEQ